MAIAAGKLLNIKDKKNTAQTNPGLIMMPCQGAHHNGTEPAEEPASDQEE